MQNFFHRWKIEVWSSCARVTSCRQFSTIRYKVEI